MNFPVKKSLLLCTILLSGNLVLFSQETEPVIPEDLTPISTESSLSQNSTVSSEKSVTDSTEQSSATELSSEKSDSNQSSQQSSLSQTSEALSSNTETNYESRITNYELPNNSELVALPYSDRPEVEKFRQLYLQPKWTKQLHDYLENALPYRLYVRKQLKEKNMPFYLEYLPIVESNYNPKAKSRSGALGMWQFMENSVYPFLTLNEYVDERLDPWKSTDAALKKLSDNYNYFGDWMLAIGAYNCGAGAMSKALKKSPEKNYWTLCEKNLLSAQTASYVPKLLAIADLVENCEYYNVDLPKHHEEYEVLEIEKQATFDYITVEAAYSLNQLAMEMRMDSSELKRLNPSYIKGFTLPAGKSEIRLPIGMEQSAKDALANLEPIDFPFKYIVKKGDSLWSISRTYGVSIKSLCEINNISENGVLRIGKILYIPSK